MTTTRAVVLVEGESDREALHALARRLGVDLAAAGVVVVAMGGVTNVRAHLQQWRRQAPGLHVSGLYDVADEHHVRRGLLAGGLPVTEVGGLAGLGWHACVTDLEDELLRALGLPAAEAVVEAAGEGPSLRLLTQMPAQRGWSRRDLLRRFLTSQSGRKARYARLFVEALDLDRAPAPLVAVLEDAVGR
ncbi:TOPRIM nucleotidyl transferase/hydrolase domain-containing protein [Janibacter sp. G349]|uniref:TOPRIM nucleotidyl transferase/hydrolase domain-containing protein n=1 Tax=Janibacter sp. G349 TaxID=3405424 RepID=UPI003B7DC332